MKRRRLTDLEDKVENVQSIGRPVLVRVCGYDAGIDYIQVLGQKDGLDAEDREKMYYVFLHKIEESAPKGADAFSASDIEMISEHYFWEGAKAVQYYKIKK